MKNSRKLNELINTGNKILKILYVLFIILLIYVVTLIVGEWKILGILGTILKVISPLFVGWFIAWLLNPLVKRMQAKGMRRGFAVVIAFIVMLITLGGILAFIIPALGDQVSEIVSAVPEITSDTTRWINNLFEKLSDAGIENIDNVKAAFMLKIQTMSNDLQTRIPTIVINLITAILSGTGQILLSLILGFYMLFDFDKVSKSIINFFPKRLRGDAKYLLSQLNGSLYSYISGTLWLSLLLFVVSIIGFSLIGLNAPVLVALICVITNLIPYIGPYLGAVVAGAIGFSQSSLIGILTLVFILVVQTIDGNVLQPLVMSKKMNLSPITIIISLLVFEYLFGIIGMVIATPVVALLKIIYNFFDEKYNFFGYKDKEEE
jgi:predicted PurR-regulated permease PerM